MIADGRVDMAWNDPVMQSLINIKCYIEILIILHSLPLNVTL